MKNREIKFRAYKFNVISESYEMLQWDSIKNNCMQFFTNPQKFNDFTPDKKGHIIMQFAGIKDVNGKDIYEGDIVINCLKRNVYDKSIQVFEFYEGTFGSRNKKDDEFIIPSLFSGRSLDGKNHTYYEVIGNIHENPELLTK